MVKLIIEKFNSNATLLGITTTEGIAFREEMDDNGEESLIVFPNDMMDPEAEDDENASKVSVIKIGFILFNIIIMYVKE